MEFGWNESKNRINIEKHGVSFYDAQYAFADPKRLILEDMVHSVDEKRYFLYWYDKRWHCHGQVRLPRSKNSYLWRRLLAERKKAL
jgi:uncharacterized DUF497 family protein